MADANTDPYADPMVDPSLDPSLDPALGNDPGGTPGYSPMLDPSTMPDTGPMQGQLGALQSMAQSYMHGIDPSTVFDKIKQGKIAALRAARTAFEKPPGEMNLPLMEFGASMIGPTRTGRLGEAIQSGVDRAIPLIQDRRLTDQWRRSGMAQIDEQQAGLEGEDLYSRMTTGMDLLGKATDLEYKIKDLQNKGLWKLLDIKTRVQVSKQAADARLQAAHIIAGQREQNALLAAVQRAQTAARQDADNLIKMGYGMQPDQLAKWVDNRTQHIMSGWGYTPEQYQGALTPGGATPGTDPSAEGDMQQELSLEQLAREGAAPQTATGQAGTDQLAPATAQPSASQGSPPGAVDAPASAGTEAGGWTRQNRPLNAEEMKVVGDNDTLANQTMLASDALNQALDVNKDAYSGDLAGAHAWAERQADWLMPGYHMSKNAIATTRMRNLVNTQVVNNLKASFGGNNITEGERNYLEQLQASIDKSPEEREPILKQGLRMLGARRRYAEWVSAKVREGTYRNQSYMDFLRESKDPMYMSLIEEEQKAASESAAKKQ